MKYINTIIIVLILLSYTLLLGCSQTVNSNSYYQTNYGEDCLYPPHTDSYKNLLFCYQSSQNKEHSQNEITNKLAKSE